MRLKQSCIRGTLIRRYKRFLADILLDTGQIVTAHCANTGAMTGLSEEGMKVWLTHSDDPGRKLAYSWRMASMSDGSTVGIDANAPNRIVREALEAGMIPEFSNYPGIRSEVRYGENSRVDFLLTADGLPDCYLEVKNVHLRRTGRLAEFPDARTERGAKHLVELADKATSGARAAILFVVQHDGCDRFSVAADIDPAYALLFEAARAVGVEAHVYRCRFSRPDDPMPEIVLDRALPIVENRLET